MTRWFLAFALLLPASLAQAFCVGTDLRADLTAAERQAMEDAVAETPFATGNHWIARKGGQTLHIIGTMHLDDPRWPPILEELAPLVRQADRLFVEMTEEEQLKMQQAIARQPEKAFITDGPTLPELLSEEDWQRLSTAMADRGVPAFMAAKMQPWMQTLMLGMPACAIQNPALAKAGLDMRLMAQAEAAGVPVSSLEGFETLFELIASGTIEDQLTMLMASLPFAQDSEDHFATTAGFYFDEESAAAWEFARVLSLRSSDMEVAEIEAMLSDFKTKLLDTRNSAWMAPILAAKEERIVIAVGALHLMGEVGVLSLLSDAGYTLTRAPFRAH